MNVTTLIVIGVILLGVNSVLALVLLYSRREFLRHIELILSDKESEQSADIINLAEYRRAK